MKIISKFLKTANTQWQLYLYGNYISMDAIYIYIYCSSCLKQRQTHLEGKICLSVSYAAAVRQWLEVQEESGWQKYLGREKTN